MGEGEAREWSHIPPRHRIVVGRHVATVADLTTQLARMADAGRTAEPDSLVLAARTEALDRRSVPMSDAIDGLLGVAGSGAFRTDAAGILQASRHAPMRDLAGRPPLGGR